MVDYDAEYKQIDDIIDARKKLGQYNVYKPSSPINYRYAYSSAATTSDKFIRFDDATLNEGDFLNNAHDLKATDSDVTVVRVRCDGLMNKRRLSKWDMHDIAVPGDGSHLGESPSLVNLATLVQQNDEYLVPLSSWDPYYGKEESDKTPEEEDCASGSQNSEDTTSSLQSKSSTISRKSSGLAGKLSRFIRKHIKKSSKTLPEP